MGFKLKKSLKAFIILLLLFAEMPVNERLAPMHCFRYCSLLSIAVIL